MASSLGAAIDIGAAGSTLNKYSSIAIGALTGGTAASLGGGKFANGAVSGAMNATYNKLMHQHASGGSSGSSSGAAADYQGKFGEMANDVANNPVGQFAVNAGVASVAPVIVAPVASGMMAPSNMSASQAFAFGAGTSLTTVGGLLLGTGAAAGPGGILILLGAGLTTYAAQ